MKETRSLKELVGRGYASFWRTRKRYRVVKGSRGSKKSKTTALWYILNMMAHPEANLLVTRRYERTLRDSCFADLQWAINKVGVQSDWKATVSPMEITRLSTGQKILFRGLDDAQKVTSITVTKGVLCWVWCEESFQLESEDEFNKLDMSIRGEVPEGLFKQITLTFNPWNESSWLKKKFFDDPSDNVFAITTNYMCNEWLDESDLQLFEEMKVKNPRRYRVEGLGEWGSTTGLIYENFEQVALDHEELSQRKDLIAFHGVDFGYTDPTTYVGGFIDKQEKIIYITKELYLKGCTNQRLIEELKKLGICYEEIYCDSAEPKSIAELNDGGINAVPSIKGPDSVLHGIQLIQNYKILIDVGCPEVYREINSYAWKEDKTGKPTDKPVHDFSHTMDGMRYGVTPHLSETTFSWTSVWQR